MAKTIDRISAFLCKLKFSKSILAVLFLIGFAASMIPIIVTAFYSVPSFDDYNFGVISHQSYMAGNGFFSGVIENAKSFYMDWQGFYTYNFLAGAQLFNINIDLYFISNITVIAFLLFSLFYFSKICLIDILQCKKVDYLLITIPVIEIIIQFLPSIEEGFYWMDGSLALLITSWFLIMVSCIVKYHILGKCKKRYLYAAFSIVLALLISGSTPIICVTYFLLFLFSFIYCLNRKSKTYKLLSIIMIILLLGLVVSIIAPGNQARMNAVEGYSFIKSIFSALYYSCVKFGHWTTLSFLAVLIFITPIFWEIASSSKYSFKYPLLVVVICYLIYAARMSIQFYATGKLGSGRQLNDYFLAFILCFSISWLYFVGWICKKTNNRITKPILSDRKISVTFSALVAFCFLIGCMGYGMGNLSSVMTLKYYIQGETKAYHDEMMERIELFNNSENKELIAEPLSVSVPFFPEESLSESKDYWTNESVAEYYNLSSVAVSHDGYIDD